MRTTSRPLSCASSSTALVTVIGNASLPRRPFDPSSLRKRSSVCSTGISFPCSSIRKTRSADRSKTAPRSAPTADTSRFACPIDSRSVDEPAAAVSATNAWALIASTRSGPSTSGSTYEAGE